MARLLPLAVFHQGRFFPAAAILLLASSFSAAPAAARTQPFDFPVMVDSAWNDAEALLVGDVDGDGRLDLISAGAGGVAWWRESAGVYTKTTVDATAALDVALGDLDQDGDLDLAIATTGNLLLARNGGTGAAFTVTTVQALAARSVAMADIDGDGRLDLLAAFTGGVDWWRNSAGNGSTFVRTTIGALTAGSGAVAADFDQDGDLDVVSSSDGASDRLRYWDNLAGTGASWSAGDVATGLDGARSPVAADFDGDGWVDVAAAALDGGEVWVLRNDHTPAGGLWPGVLAVSTGTPRRLAVADLDRDGDADLLLAGGDTIRWLERLAAAPLAFADRLVGPATSARVVAAADFDRDEDLDLAFAGALDDDLVYLPNPSNRRNFVARAQQDVETIDGARSVTTGDLDNDGDVDLVVSGYASNQVRWEENTAAGWVAHALPGGLNGAFEVTLADLDGDGDLDVIAAGESAGAVIWWKNGWPLVNSFTRLSVGALASARGVAVGDLDRDGDLDVAAAGLGDDVAVFANNGTATAFTRTFLATTFNSARDVDLGDLDGDGDLDVLAVAYTGDEVAWWQNDGTGLGWTKRTIFLGTAPIDGFFEVRARDLDQDGDLDVLVSAEIDDKIAFIANGGDGLTWAAPVGLGFFNQAQSAEVADFDGDGDLDVIGAAWKDGGRIAFFRNNDGIGTSWTKNELTITFDGAGSVAVADVNRDGLPDFVATAETVDKVAVWLNGGGQAALATTVLSGSTLPANAETALFRLVLTPRGLPGDHGAELAAVDLQLEEAPGDLLTAGEADALLEQIAIYRDNPSAGTVGTLDPLDIGLANRTSFTPSASGVVRLPIADDVPFAAVAQGASGTFFVTVTTAASYASLAIRDFRVTHLGDAAKVEDRSYDTDLRLEWSANGATALFPINDFADLAADVTDDVDPVVAGNNVAYTVMVSNAGPDAAIGVALTSTLPAGATLVSTTGCSQDPGGVPTCSIGNLAVGASDQVTVVVAVPGNAGAPLHFQAQVAGTLFDPALADNSAEETTTVTASADLAIAIDTPFADYAAGAPLPWRVVVSSNGPGSALAATVSVDLPAALTAVAWTCTPSPGAACTASGSGDIVSQTVNLPAGGTLTYRIRSQVPPGTTGLLNATASVAIGPATVDGVAGNNSDAQGIAAGNKVFYDGFESGNTSAWSITTP